MTDPYLEKYADVLLNFSLGEIDLRKAWLSSQKRLLLQYDPLADELARLIAEKVFEMGGNVFVRPIPSWFEYVHFAKAAKEVLSAPPVAELALLKFIAADIIISADDNTRSLASIDPEKRIIYANAREPYKKEMLAIDEKGEYLIPWTLTQFPTPAYAQDADMSFPDYKLFAYRAMFLDMNDPIAAWKAVSDKQQRLIDEHFAKAETVRIVDEKTGTDLIMSVKGHKWINSDGKHNFPSHEIFNAPRKSGVNGTLNIFGFPQYYRSGPEVSNISITFKNGRAVKWHADRGNDFLTKFLQSSTGADMLGEIGIGMHPRIQQITKQILFDEKIGGSVHLAFGSAYESHVTGNADKSSLNESPEHWDMIHDMRHDNAYIELRGPEIGTRRLFWDKKKESWAPQ